MPSRLFRRLSIALVLGGLLAGAAVLPTAAQEATYPTRNEAKTETILLLAADLGDARGWGTAVLSDDDDVDGDDASPTMISGAV